MEKTSTYLPDHNSACDSLVLLRPSQNAYFYHLAKVNENNTKQIQYNLTLK